MKNLKNKWKKEEKLLLSIKLKDFKEVMDLVNQISKIAEELDHHPNLRIYNYNWLEIEIYTHKKNVVTEADYELAKRIDEVILFP